MEKALQKELLLVEGKFDKGTISLFFNIWDKKSEPRTKVFGSDSLHFLKIIEMTSWIKMQQVSLLSEFVVLKYLDGKLQ